MLVDCQTCPVRGVRCTDCVVTALSALPVVTTSRPSGPVHDPVVHHAHDPDPELGAGPGDPGPTAAPLDRAERRAVSALLAAGLVTTATANAAVAVVERPRARAGSAARIRHAG